MEQGPPIWKKTIRCASLTDIGLRRANNQDSYAVVVASSGKQWLDRGHLFVVADGMGAHAAGEVASRYAVDTITQSYASRKNEPPHVALAAAFHDAHHYLREKSAQEEAFRDMGTTADALLLLPQGALIAHVGDSRVYRVRHETIEQLTFDHSLVWEVCMATNLAFDKAPSYIPKNQITRSLGPTENMKVDLEGLFPIAVGDTFLLCSDGLSGQMNDREIGQVLTVFPPDIAVETLINLANLRGGPDNITAIVVQAGPTSPGDQEIDETKPIPISAWAALAASILGLLSFAFSLIYGFMAVCAISLGATIFFAAMFMTLSAKTLFRRPIYDEMSPPLGKGPYTRSPCFPSEEFAGKLTTILKELRQATQNDRWSISSPSADSAENEAHTAMEQGDMTGAIRNYSLAVNHLMRELKRVSAKKR